MWPITSFFTSTVCGALVSPYTTFKVDDDDDEQFIKELYGDQWRFFVFVTVAADPSQQMPDRARQAIEKIKGYIINYLEGHNEQIPQLMGWAVHHLPAADEATIRAAFASHLLKLNEGRDLSDEYGSSSILQERMCLVVDDEVVESAARGPELDELDDDDNKGLEGNVFVKVCDVGHPPGTYEVVAISGRLQIPSNQIRYEGWTKATPRSLYDLYDSAICRCNGYGRGFCGPNEIHDW